MPLLTTGHGQLKVPESNKRRNPHTSALPIFFPLLRADHGVNDTLLVCGNWASGIFDSLHINIHDSLGPQASMADRWLIYLCGKAGGKHLPHKKMCVSCWQVGSVVSHASGPEHFLMAVVSCFSKPLRRAADVDSLLQKCHL